MVYGYPLATPCVWECKDTVCRRYARVKESKCTKSIRDEDPRRAKLHIHIDAAKLGMACDGHVARVVGAQVNAPIGDCAVLKTANNECPGGTLSGS